MGSLIGSSFRDTLCTEFNGSTQYGYVDDPTFKGNTQGAFLMRFRQTTDLADPDLRGILGYGVKDAANNSFWRLGLRSNGSATIPAPFRFEPIPEIVSRTTNAGTASNAIGQQIVPVATWVSLVVQSNGVAWSIYYNGAPLTITAVFGSPVNTGDWLGDTSGSDHRLTLGSQFISNAPGAYGDHRQNEVIYVNRPLTAGEVTEWYNSGNTQNANRLSFRADIESWWMMGDGNDTNAIIYDRIGSNDLILVNTPSIVAYP